MAEKDSVRFRKTASTGSGDHGRTLYQGESTGKREESTARPKAGGSFPAGPADP